MSHQGYALKWGFGQNKVQDVSFSSLLPPPLPPTPTNLLLQSPYPEFPVP